MHINPGPAQVRWIDRNELRGVGLARRGDIESVDALAGRFEPQRRIVMLAFAVRRRLDIRRVGLIRGIRWRNVSCYCGAAFLLLAAVPEPNPTNQTDYYSIIQLLGNLKIFFFFLLFFSKFCILLSKFVNISCRSQNVSQILVFIWFLVVQVNNFQF